MVDIGLRTPASWFGATSTALALTSANAAVPTDTTALRDAVTVEGIMAHEQAFQAIADANDGSRASGTPGYDASADYVAGLLTSAGYEVSQQVFEFPFFSERSPASWFPPMTSRSRPVRLPTPRPAAARHRTSPPPPRPSPRSPPTPVP